MVAKRVLQPDYRSVVTYLHAMRVAAAKFALCALLMMIEQSTMTVQTLRKQHVDNKIEQVRVRLQVVFSGLDD